MPHIRLNSGRQDPFLETNEGYEPLNSGPVSRPLTPQPEAPEAVSAQEISSPYGVSNVPTSSELLLPPRSRPSQRQESDRPFSPDRWSWSRSSVCSSDRISRETGVPMNPFEDSRSASYTGSEEYDVNTQTVSEKFNIMPTDGLLLFPEDVEKDDYLHNPDPADKDRDCDVCNRRGILNVGGLAILTLGFLTLFVGYPVM